ncbi:MAG: ATP synthase F1 subunit gamma [Deltaproteobacteria bacterium]
MPSLKAIRKRVATVKSTQQITKAMQMVAAAKLRRAQEAAVASRPYGEKLQGMVHHLLGREAGAGMHPLMQIPATSKRMLVVFVTSDRGLCGGYNANLWRDLKTFTAGRSEEISYFVVGRKGNDTLKNAGIETRDFVNMPAVKDAPEVARDISLRVQRLFMEGEYDDIRIVYSAFKSAMTQTPTIEELLPLRKAETDDPTTQSGHDYVFEPGAMWIIATLLPRLIEVQILHALLEAGASELAARMTAMDSATRNASEMIERLTLQMNRARQAQITTELMEIISGAEALKG